jgi:hypothetical protein
MMSASRPRMDAEVTRSGQVIRTGRFMADRVIAVVEHPAAPR